MKLATSVCTVCAMLLLVPIMAEGPANVTMVQLIANPERYDGKRIRVIGFLRLEFEGNVLFLHREDCENAILGDGIWVDATPQMAQNKALNMKYVLLEGTFDSGDKGHMGMWSGTITNIRRAEVWTPPLVRKK